MAMSRRKQGRRRMQFETWMLVEAKIRMDWSPEQISGWKMSCLNIFIKTISQQKQSSQQPCNLSRFASMTAACA
jgi:IS30 family transposase